MSILSQTAVTLLSDLWALRCVLCPLGAPFIGSNTPHAPTLGKPWSGDEAGMSHMQAQ